MAQIPNPITSRQDKVEVNYRVGYKCQNCAYFQHPSGCSKVAGTISPEAVCDLWEAIENNKPYTKEFYIRELEKSNG